jgi:hypothetical protein
MKTKVRLLIETEKLVLVQDMNEAGHTSVTNAAEMVVEWVLARQVGSSPEIFYVDTDGRVDQLCHADGKFSGFAFRYGSLREFQKELGLPISGIAAFTISDSPTPTDQPDKPFEIVLAPFVEMTDKMKDGHMRAAIISPVFALAMLSALKYPKHSVVISDKDISLAVPKNESFPLAVKPHETDTKLALMLYVILGEAMKREDDNDYNKSDKKPE